jgi:hypothetical protein
MSQLNPGLVYDVATVSRILGLLCECNDPVPNASPGEVAIYYGGWTLQELRVSVAGKQRMLQEKSWYDDEEWKAEPGYYRLLLPVPHSNGQNRREQLVQLHSRNGSAWQAASVCIVATALLVHLQDTGEDLLQRGWCRCAEPSKGDSRVAVSLERDCCLSIGSVWDDFRDYWLWLAATQKADPAS